MKLIKVYRKPEVKDKSRFYYINADTIKTLFVKKIDEEKTGNGYGYYVAAGIIDALDGPYAVISPTYPENTSAYAILNKVATFLIQPNSAILKIGEND